jgi:hypothetical protein
VPRLVGEFEISQSEERPELTLDTALAGPPVEDLTWDSPRRDTPGSDRHRRRSAHIFADRAISVQSHDAGAPPWGPGFLRLNAWPYRAEYAAATIAILIVLFGWRGVIEHDLPWTVLLAVGFWALWPDLVAFLPIGLASRDGTRWPHWGPGLYNVFHSLLVWAVVFALWSWLNGQIGWPLLAWAGHITADRAAGFHLRASQAPSSTIGS